MVGPGSAAGAAAFNWPVFVLRAQREGEQVLRCNQFDQQTKAGAGLCLVYTGDTSSGSTQPRGAQGLFAEPARGFSFRAAVSALGAWGLCPAPDQGSSPGSPAGPGHLTSPCHPMRTVPQPPAQSSPARASAGPGSPQKPAFCSPLRPAEARAGVAGLSRRAGICFLPTARKELPVRGSCRTSRWGPHAVLQGPAAHTQGKAGPWPVARVGATECPFQSPGQSPSRSPGEGRVRGPQGHKPSQP